MNFAAKAVLTGFAAALALSSVPAMAQTQRPEVIPIRQRRVRW